MSDVFDVVDPRAAVSAPPAAGGSVLDAVLAEIHTDLQSKTVDLPVPAQPRFKLRVSVWAEGNRRDALIRSCIDPMLPNGIDTNRLALGVVSAQTVGLLLDDDLIVEGGKPLTFASPTLQKHLGVDSEDAAIRAFLGGDGWVSKMAAAINTRCGYGLGLDPTTA